MDRLELGKDDIRMLAHMLEAPDALVGDDDQDVDRFVDRALELRGEVLAGQLMLVDALDYTIAKRAIEESTFFCDARDSEPPTTYARLVRAADRLEVRLSGLLGEPVEIPRG